MPSNKASMEWAAAYVRMSTDHQNYSADNQMVAIRKYADSLGLKIVAEFADEGKSGISIKKRDAIKRMLGLIDSGKATFKHILVYDVSRWGRFLDPDEGAYYEFKCKQAGIRVHYCAEMFNNDGSLASDISKILKRKMAHELVRELSVKVLQGQCNLIRRGFKQGGFAGYGLRRALIDENGNFKCILKHGEKKSIQSDRVILIHGPLEEVQNIKLIYSLFIDEGKRENEIADLFNSKGIVTDLERQWTASSIRQILTNEKYIGNYLFNKTSQRIEIQNPFSTKRVCIKNPPEEWVRFENGFEPIIKKEHFDCVQKIMAERAKHYTDEYLLDELSKLYKKHGMVSGILINGAVDIPSTAVYAHRFGSLINAYHLIGYTPERDYSYIQINRMVREMHSDIVGKMIFEASKHGVNFEGFDEISINGEVSLSVVVSRCRVTSNGRAAWLLKMDRGLFPDFTIAVRLNPDNRTIKDYYVISKYDLNLIDKRLCEQNGLILDTFRHDSIDWFYDLFKRKPIGKDAI